MTQDNGVVRHDLDQASCDELGNMVTQTRESLIALRWLLKGYGYGGRDGRLVIDAAHIEVAPEQEPKKPFVEHGPGKRKRPT